MKVVFCIDDNPRYLLLLKAAVRSLRALHGPDAPEEYVDGFVHFSNGFYHHFVHFSNIVI